MEFTNTFQVEAPIAEVWKLLLDVEQIAPCMPGAQVIEQTADDAYKIAVKVKVGPMTMNYKGDIEIVEKDEAAHRATMQAKAKEARGQGTASADIVMSLSEQAGGTQASIVTSMKISGKAAAMGQGVIKDVAGTLTDTFAENLAGLVNRGSVPADGADAVPAGGLDAAAVAEAPDAASEGAPGTGTTAVPQAGATPTDTGAEPLSGEDAPSHAPEPPRASEPYQPPPPAAEASLPVGKLAVAVVTGRLRDPRTVGGLAVAVVVATVVRRRRR